jgi:FkbM family methyltransferase
MLYKTIKKLGYKIENQKKQYKRNLTFLSSFYNGDNPVLLTRTINFIKPLKEMYNDLYIVDEDNGYRISFNGIQFFVESYEEFLITHEVFVSSDYHFSISQESVVFDIGGNIGLSALYFSQFDTVIKVYSFEPVTPTYHQALKNFKLNEELSKKIVAYNFGLSDKTEKATFLFNPNVKGNTGIRAEKSTSFVREQSFEIEVQLKEVTSVFEDLINENPTKKIVVKMDCEGGEYAIFNSLKHTPLFEKIDILMMEYHDKGSTDLEEILIQNGFSFFNQTYSKDTGMLYAFK